MKKSSSKKFVATLPYLLAPSEEEINQMEIGYSLSHLYTATENFFFDSLQKQVSLGEWLHEISTEKYPNYPHQLGFSNAYHSYWDISWNDFFYCEDLDYVLDKLAKEAERDYLEGTYWQDGPLPIEEIQTS